MKQLLIFASIAFLCLSCQKRAPFNLSAPPESIYQDKQSAATINPNERLKGLEAGNLVFENAEGRHTLDLKGACPIQRLGKEALLFSCLNFKEREDLAQMTAPVLKEIDMKPLFQASTFWEAQFETYLYWPETKKMILLAEHDLRQKKLESKILFQGDIAHSDFYLIIRLKKIAEVAEGQVLSLWSNQEELELSSFDEMWRKSEESKVTEGLEFDKEYSIRHLEEKKTIQLEFSTKLKVPTFTVAQKSVTAEVIEPERVRDLKRSYGIGCAVDEKVFNGFKEEDLNLNQYWVNLHLRVILGAQEYSLTELMAWGKASLTKNHNKIKVKIHTKDFDMSRGLKVVVLPYPEEKYSVGYVGPGSCFRNSNTVVIRGYSTSPVTAYYSLGEVYRGVVTFQDEI